MDRTRPNLIAKWLFLVAAMVVAIVVVGGITRLTESGLSITEWKPVSGMLPPMSEAAWAEAFAKYQATPEYREINAGMSLAAFKFIFFWEWVHRVLGAADWAGPHPAFDLVLDAGCAPQNLRAAHIGGSGYGRTAGLDRLVDGGIRALRADGCEPFQACDPPIDRAHHSGGVGLDGA